MKMLFAKLSSLVLLLVAVVWIANVQPVRASVDDAASNIEITDLDQLKTSMGVTCTGWSKIGSGSECTCYYNGSCIGYKYWDNERRACGIPGSSWWWHEYRRTNERTAGPSC